MTNNTNNHTSATQLTNKVILITGGSSGIGKATAIRAAEAGAKIALAARDAEKLTELAEQLRDQHSATVATFSCDVQDWASQQQMAADIMSQFGQLDIVFANAGRGNDGGGYSGGDPEQWREVTLTNVLGPALTLRATLEHVKAKQGHIVVTGSVAGRRTLPGSFYGITKWAMAGLARNLREELKGSGVRVTLIEPGMVDTAFFDEPKNDALQPDDIARSVLFALTQPAGVELHDLCVLPTPPTG